jgi:hypothetical protein
MNAEQSLNSERGEGAHKVSGPKSAFDRDRSTQIGDDQHRSGKLVNASSTTFSNDGALPQYQ